MMPVKKEAPWGTSHGCTATPCLCCTVSCVLLQVNHTTATGTKTHYAACPCVPQQAKHWCCCSTAPLHLQAAAVL